MTPAEFVNRFINHYGFVDITNPKGLVDDYVAALTGTDVDVLRAASDRLLKEHQFRNWPTLGECRIAIDKAALERTSERDRNRREPEQPRQEPTPEQRQRVNDLVKATTERIATHAKRCEGKRVLDVIYADIHGRPYRKADWS